MAHLHTRLRFSLWITFPLRFSLWMSLPLYLSLLAFRTAARSAQYEPDAQGVFKLLYEAPRVIVTAGVQSPTTVAVAVVCAAMRWPAW